MRPIFVTQTQFGFQPQSELRITLEYYARYDAISTILDTHPEVIRRIHADIGEALDCERSSDGSQPDQYKCASESFLRILICIIVEGWSLREGVIRIDDSHFLRQFTRIFNDPMIDFTTFCHLRSRVSPETWVEVNQVLSSAVVKSGQVSGNRVRLDTTAVETDIHWPTDSSLLQNCYTTLARLLANLRELDPAAVGTRRMQLCRVKRLQQRIARRGRSKSADSESLKPLYLRLIQLVHKLCTWCDESIETVRAKHVRGVYPEDLYRLIARTSQRMSHFRGLASRVMKQAYRRVIEGKSVPNDQKLFSIHEPHTELLKRGKAGKPIEFGHMVQIQQVENKFITHYDVFEKKPVEHELVAPALERHRALFGKHPDEVAADKGYYRDRAQLETLGKKVKVLAINKKGKRSEAERQRESDPSFKLAQRFRAGVEGSISYLKRVLGLARCYTRGWRHYAATVGATIFVHNLLILARC